MFPPCLASRSVWLPGLLVFLLFSSVTSRLHRLEEQEEIRRLEEATGLDIRAAGFPAEILDDEPEEPGYEVVPVSEVGE